MPETEPAYHLTYPMERIQERVGRPLRDELDERYNARGQTLEEIGTDLGVSAASIHRYMRRLGLEARFPGQRGTAA